jgi:ribosomal protein S4E
MLVQGGYMQLILDDGQPALVERISLKPGDTILVSLPTPISNNARQQITNFFQFLFPDHACVVADAGAKVCTIGPSESL